MTSKKGGVVMKDYKRDIVKMLDQLDNEEYIKYIYVLLKTFIEK